MKFIRRKKGHRRHSKKAGEKRRREAVQRTRLLGLGASEAQVKRLNAAEVRTLLARPAAAKKMWAARASG